MASSAACVIYMNAWFIYVSPAGKQVEFYSSELYDQLPTSVGSTRRTLLKIYTPALSPYDSHVVLNFTRALIFFLTSIFFLFGGRFLHLGRKWGGGQRETELVQENKVVNISGNKFVAQASLWVVCSPKEQSASFAMARNIRKWYDPDVVK